VTNCGNVSLTNVIVTNFVAALGLTTNLVGPLTLAPGAGAIFSGSFVVPLDSCGPYTESLGVVAADKCFGHVINTNLTFACPGTNSPAVVVTKTCPLAPVQPGQPLVFGGSVSNAGNIT